MRYSEIVTAARLNTSTAQYVLKHPSKLLSLPRSGSQGVHREFNFRQATDFALATWLVHYGLTLPMAAAAVHFANVEISHLHQGPKSETEPFQVIGPYRIVLLVVDREFVALTVEHRVKKLISPRKWYALSEAKVVDNNLDPRTDSIAMLSVNVTKISRLLARG